MTWIQISRQNWFGFFAYSFEEKWKALTPFYNLSHLILWHIKFRYQFFEVRMMGGYINPSLWSITSSSHVFTNSESRKPDFFSHKIFSLFWSVLNGFSFKNQNRLLNANFMEKKSFFFEKLITNRKFRIRENMWWTRT